MSPGSCGGSLSPYSSSRRSLSRGSRRSLGSRDGSARGPPCPVGPPRWYTADVVLSWKVGHPGWPRPPRGERWPSQMGHTNYWDGLLPGALPLSSG